MFDVLVVYSLWMLTGNTVSLNRKILGESKNVLINCEDKSTLWMIDDGFRTITSVDQQMRDSSNIYKQGCPTHNKKSFN